MRHEIPRYRFLDTIRAYALDQLRASDDAGPTQLRYQEWCVDLLHAARFELWRSDQINWMAWLDREIDNVRAALDWSALNPASVGEVFERCSFALFRYWDVRGSVGEARNRFSTLLEQAPRRASVVGIAQTQAYLA